MPYSAVGGAGVFRPEEIDTLSRVFEQIVSKQDDEETRADRAEALVNLFRCGVTDEAMLVSLMSEKIICADV